ncbi:MAG: Crp/Fnr family transcriptional regulator [Deltaproteobacteria bacterium]|nr:Crp/Fnr family transcriptional regulator [Deltaproteobacteria bacterium]
MLENNTNKIIWSNYMGVSEAGSNEIYQEFKNRDVVNFFMEQGKLLTIPKGTAVYSPGEAADKIYYVNHGEIKVSRSTNDGKEIILDILGPGSIFGEVEVICGRDRKNLLLTKKDTILHFITSATFNEKLLNEPRLFSWFLKKISDKQLKTEDLLENLLFKSANAKVALMLLDLAKNHGVNIDKGVLIDYIITHQEIGNTIATTRETVSYAFMEFRQLGWIDTVKRRTVILNREALEEVASE